MFDLGIEAARAAVKIPVVGLGSATYHVAAELADRFAIICTNEKTVPEHMRRLRLMGFNDNIISIKSVNIPILESIERREELESKFFEIAKTQINVEGAQLIIAGTGSIFAALGPGSRQKMGEQLGVPVIEGSGIALNTLEMFVKLELVQSKRAFPSPD